MCRGARAPKERSGVRTTFARQWGARNTTEACRTLRTHDTRSSSWLRRWSTSLSSALAVRLRAGGRFRPEGSSISLVVSAAFAGLRCQVPADSSAIEGVPHRLARAELRSAGRPWPLRRRGGPTQALRRGTCAGMLARARSAAAAAAMAARTALTARGRGFFSGAADAGPAVSLPHRSVLRLRGRDSVSFLQGMCTQDVEAGLASGGPASRFATVLSPKGRVRFETVLWRASDDPGDVCVEVSSSLLGRVARLIDRYQVRESFAVERPEDVHVVQLLPADMRQLAAPDRVMEAYTAAAQTSSASAAFAVSAALDAAWGSAGQSAQSHLEVMAASPDPRCPVMGLRALVRGPAASLSVAAPAAPTAYSLVRSLMGVPEGEAEVFEAVPLELNLEQLLGVSFVKGCYVGQELVARAHFRGLLRKRLLPVVLGQGHLGAAVAPPPSEGDAGHRLALEGGREITLPGVPGVLFEGADCASERDAAALQAARRLAEASQAAAAAPPQRDTAGRPRPCHSAFGSRGGPRTGGPRRGAARAGSWLLCRAPTSAWP